MIRWAAGQTAAGLPLRRLHCFLPGYRRSLCKKRLASERLVDATAGLPLCVACARRAAERGLGLPAPDDAALLGISAASSGLTPGELGWRAPIGATLEHAFVGGQLRSLCGRYQAEAHRQATTASGRCTPCQRKAASRGPSV